MLIHRASARVYDCAFVPPANKEAAVRSTRLYNYEDSNNLYYTDDTMDVAVSESLSRAVIHIVADDHASRCSDTSPFSCAHFDKALRFLLSIVKA